MIVKITQGMSELVKERPPNPIEYLASYLLRHDPARAGTIQPTGDVAGKWKPQSTGTLLPYSYRTIKLENYVIGERMYNFVK